MSGFVVSAFGHLQPQFLKDMSGWITAGDLKYQETIFDGIHSRPKRLWGYSRVRMKAKCWLTSL